MLIIFKVVESASDYVAGTSGILALVIFIRNGLLTEELIKHFFSLFLCLYIIFYFADFAYFLPDFELHFGFILV